MKIECKTRRRIVAKKPQNIVLYYCIKKNAFHVFGNLRGRVRRRLHADVRLRFAESAFVSP
jgi:hypothetical protein